MWQQRNCLSPQLLESSVSGGQGVKGAPWAGWWGEEHQSRGRGPPPFTSHPNCRKPAEKKDPPSKTCG